MAPTSQDTYETSLQYGGFDVFASIYKHDCLPNAIPRRHVAVESRAHECTLDPTAHTELVGLPELLREDEAGDAAVHLGGDRQLGELHDAAVDRVPVWIRDGTCSIPWVASGGEERG